MSYIITSTRLSDEFIHSEIVRCMDSLYSVNDMVYDYWLSELFDDTDAKILENWTEANLMELYKDVSDNK